MLKQNRLAIDSLDSMIEESALPPENIVVLNETRSAADLYRLIATDSIDINPDFQRNEVWNDSDMARFIDSLTKEFPIPSMCFALDPKVQKYIVIDGLQRMSTIARFLSTPDWVLPKLEDIDGRLSGKSIAAIKKSDPAIYRKVENISLPVTILRYDPNRNDNMEYIFTIFQRLNTCGLQLNNQEIRNAIYQGPFNAFIKMCAENGSWLELVKNLKTAGDGNKRMFSEERVLRFFAFYEDLNSYWGKLIKFLNNYMQTKRFSADNVELQIAFSAVIEIAGKIDVSKAKFSNAVQDAILYGISKNLNHLESQKVTTLNQYLNKLVQNKHFLPDELSEAVMRKQKVMDRLSTAKKIFSGK